jgi:hypothetical protein
MTRKPTTNINVYAIEKATATKREAGEASKASLERFLPVVYLERPLRVDRAADVELVRVVCCTTFLADVFDWSAWHGSEAVRAQVFGVLGREFAV